MSLASFLILAGVILFALPVGMIIGARWERRCQARDLVAETEEWMR